MTFTSKAAGTQAGRRGVGRGGQTEIRIPALPLLADLFGQINFSALSSLNRVVCEKCLAMTYSLLPATSSGGFITSWG